MKHYLNRQYWYGVAGDLRAALADPDAPTTPEGARLTEQDFEEVSAEEYEDVLDIRYENGEWQQ
jgi:hypothetical protein